MPRKKYDKIKRDLKPDCKYGNEIVTRFVGRMMLNGKRIMCQNILYRSLESISAKLEKPPIEIFLQALMNARPLVEVKSRRVGGSTFQIPIEISDSRREALAMRWIIGSARRRQGRSMLERLSAELMDAYNGAGSACKKKEDIHKVAEANRAFAHLR